MSFTRTIDGVTYCDHARLWESISKKDVAVPKRLKEYMSRAGVIFYAEEPGDDDFVMQPKVVVTGFGGFGVSFDESTPAGKLVLNGSVRTPQEIMAELKATMGIAGFESYMNPFNKSAAQMDAITSKHGHFSKTHVMQVDLLLLGYSAVTEVMLMRDLRKCCNHIGQTTTTRTLAQSSPPLVVMNPEDLPQARKLRRFISELVAQQAPPQRGELSSDQFKLLIDDYYERTNALWPCTKALHIMANADVRDLSGCMDRIADKNGQEREFRQVLALVNDTMWHLMPELFEHSSSYGYEMPTHWPAYKQWDEERTKIRATA